MEQPQLSTNNKQRSKRISYSINAYELDNLSFVQSAWACWRFLIRQFQPHVSTSRVDWPWAGCTASGLPTVVLVSSFISFPEVMNFLTESGCIQHSNSLVSSSDSGWAFTGCLWHSVSLVSRSESSWAVTF